MAVGRHWYLLSGINRHRILDKSEAKTVPFEKSLYMALITGIELYNVILVIFCFENYLLIIAVFFHH